MIEPGRRLAGLPYLLFFCSGLSGLIYQVVWVRVFGNVFGNTIYSASIVVAVFMLGLGAGSYLIGVWADRRYATRPESLLRAYGYVELIVAALGLGISAALPHLDQLSALISSYSREAQGWYVLSPASYLARAGIAVVLLAPITLLMGGTLTLLIRHLIRRDLAAGGWRIALLYGVNTAGAAVGCLLTDFALVPAYGLRSTQFIAAFFNLSAGAGALYLAAREARPAALRVKRGGHVSDSGDGGLPPSRTPQRRSARGAETFESPVAGPALLPSSHGWPLLLISLALALSGFAAMGMEILWFRHFTILLGQFRAVFSLLLAIILTGIGAGALASGIMQRRIGRPGATFIVVQGLFVGATLFGLWIADAAPIDEAIRVAPSTAGVAAAMARAQSGSWGTIAELWFNARPILLEVMPAALLMGFSFPLANAIVQRAERAVGQRAGILYLANTVGAVAGSLATGFFLLPVLGMQRSAMLLMAAAALVIVPLYLGIGFASGAITGQSASSPAMEGRRTRRLALASLGLAVVALALWGMLPDDRVIARALPRRAANERLLALTEGLNEVITVTDAPGTGLRLLTNGHPMSSTTRIAQRYMRALAHIPLLSMERPEAVLVIGFGVGNTTHAATLHPSIRRVEVADLSRAILGHARYFEQVNGNVLADPRVAVYVNDGRQHLQMQPPASYDLVTLEPPPIAYAGVAALYSREFYALARTRLKPGGYVSQWLPAYQVPTATTLAMIRAFVDVFPGAVLISGAESDLLLLGANGARVEVDPDRLAARLAGAPAVRADMERLDLGSVTEIVGTFIGSARTLADATRRVSPVTDDRPIQEYGVMSLLNFGQAVPGAVVDLAGISAWCPGCFVDGRPRAPVEGLEMYLALLRLAYAASPDEVRRTRALAETEGRVVAGSAYLGAIVPESASLHNLLAISMASAGRLDEAIGEFRTALRLEPESAVTHWHLGAALAARGAQDEAVDHLRVSVRLDPSNGDAHTDLGLLLAQRGALDEAIVHFERALALMPGSPQARANLERARERVGRGPSN